ncbi:MAG: glycosyltransferase, partial [Bacteroidota bacterium]
ALGARLHLASSGSALSYFRLRFPHLPTYPLPGYQVTYGRGRHLWWALGKQVPRLLSVIHQEHLEVQRLTQAHHFDLIISDHRYGVHSPDVQSIFLAHQLSLRMPGGEKNSHLLDRIHAHWLRPFTQVWAPDFPPPEGLAGGLIQEFSPRPPDLYLGPLSRMPSKPDPGPEQQARPLALVSGPEPQRSLFEDLLTRQAHIYQIPLRLIRGLPGADPHWVKRGWVERIGFLDQAALAQALVQAKLVICRAGYSTLMDAHKLGLKHLLLVPTPGQTEQIYLAKRLVQKQVAHMVTQSQLDLARDLPLAQASQGWPIVSSDFPSLSSLLSEWLSQG